MYPDAGAQGLFLSVPAGSFDADRFAQCGPAAEMPPDPLLATIIDAVTGPDGPGAGALSDDQLIGVIAAVRRLESRVAWYALTAVAEFAARWGGEVAGAEFAADQLACELHLTSRSAAVQLDYATSVAARLPRCLAALYAGSLHPVHLRIIEEETQVLSPEDAATADAALAAGAGALTFGKLRSAAHRLVLELDPDAAAAAEGRRAAGRVRAAVPGAVRERRDDRPGTALRRGARLLAACGAAGAGPARRRDPRHPGRAPRPRLPGSAARTPDQPRRARPGPGWDIGHGRPAGHWPRRKRRRPGWKRSRPRSGGRPRAARGRPGGLGGADAGPSLAALVTITVPWSTLTGQSATPAEVGGFGIVDAADARDLAAAAARDPRTRWCVTALHPDGTAAAHGCAPGRHLPARHQHPHAPRPGPGPDCRRPAAGRRTGSAGCGSR